MMSMCKFLVISILLQFYYGPFFANYSESSSKVDSIIAAKELYSRHQVDSIVYAEIVKNFDTLVTIKTQERLINYISEQNNHHEQENNRLTWIAILVTIVALAGPFIINRQYEKLIEKNLEDNLKYINWYISSIEEQIDNKVADSLERASDSVKSYTTESKETIDSKIDEGLKQVKDIINTYEENLNSLKTQVEAFAQQAKLSGLKADRTAQDIEIGKIMDEYNKESDINKKIELLFKRYQIDPKDTDNLKTLAEKYASISEYDNAIKFITQYINIKDIESDGYSLRARYYLLKNDTSNAIQDYSLAINAENRHGKGKDIDALYYDRGSAYENENQLKEALEDYKKAKDIASRNDSGINTYIEAISRVEEKISNKDEKGSSSNMD